MTFAGAPVSKGLICGLGCITLLAAASSRQYLFSVPLSPHLTRDHQIWRLLVHHTAFANSSEFFLAILLLFYTALPTERTFGSAKFASFLVVTTGLSTFLELVMLLLGSRFGFTQIPAGPFAIVFAIIYQATRLVPTTYTWKVFGLELSSRFTLYILAAQLVASQPPLSVFPSFIGIFSSYLYRADFLSMRAYRLSPRFVLLATRLFGPLIGSSATPRRTTSVHFGQDIPALQAGIPGVAFGRRVVVASTAATTAATTPGRTSPAGVAAPPATGGFVEQWTEGITGVPRQPSAQQIAELNAIFPDQPREAVITALQRSQLDLNRAVEVLLSTS